MNRAAASSLLTLFGMLIGPGCDRETPPATVAPATDAALTVAPMLPPSETQAAWALANALGPADAGPQPPIDSGAPHALAADPFPGAKVSAGKSIGHTSVVFKLTLASGQRAAFKPTSHRGGARFRGEIAAYRLGVALGLTNVPPAFEHDFVASDLRAALDSQAAALFTDEAVITDAGLVRGALIPWIDGLAFPAVERDPLHAAWSDALKHDAPVPADDLANLAAQMSTLIVFDVLDGNWDRWSGGNIGQVQDTYLYIDNDGAFFPNPPAKAMTRGWARLDEVDRFSRDFVTRLRGWGDGDGGVLATSGLGDLAIKGFRERRTKVLAVIDAKIARYGEASVLAFP